MIVDQDTICERLGVDAYGLERLIETGGLAATGTRGARQIEQKALEHYLQRRLKSREDAFKALGKLDGPYV